MSQYFHIKTDITFCLGLGSFFNFSCPRAPLVYMAGMQIRSSNTDLLVN